MVLHLNLSRYRNDIITEYVTVDKIVCSNNCLNTGMLLSDSPRQISVENDNLCNIESGGSVLLDFGEELHGGINISVQKVSSPSTYLRVVFGESVMEALSDLGQKNSSNDHSPRDITCAINDYSNVRIGYTGFRFVKIEAVGGTISLAGVCAAFDHRDIKCRGKFESSDPLLNKIWNTGVRTVFLNMQEYLWDGIKRDRLVWIGDMHAEVSAISCSFGDCDIVNKSLDFVMDNTKSDGWMNGIPSYSLWWIIIQYEWYWYTGNKEYINKNSAYIINHIKKIVRALKNDGTLKFECDLGYLDESNPYKSYFIDWETYGTNESQNGFYSILIMALRASSFICNILGEKTLLRECIEGMSLIQSMTFSQAQNRQMASLMALADLEDAKSVNKRLLSREPVADITAFLGYYTLLAKGRADDVGGAVDIIKKYWGRMIELGATTFWESFDYLGSKDAYPIDCIVPEGKKSIHGDYGAFCYRDFRGSLCHGWACGPTPFLSKYVLGVNIADAGCKKLLIKPSLDSVEWINGVFPTPYGDVEISVEKSNNKKNIKVNAPQEIKIIY